MSKTYRNWEAVNAHNRNSAGPMESKRRKKGGRNKTVDHLEEYLEDKEEDDKEMEAVLSILEDAGD